MIEAPHFSTAGKQHKAAFSLPEAIFDGTVNDAVLHQAVMIYQGNQRQGTAKTKRRQEVSGGGAKPWKQKGTGRARAGTIRAAQWRGGGVVFGPIPRDYRRDIPKKVRQLARRSAMNARAREGMLRIIDGIDFDVPKTSALLELVGKLDLGTGRVLILTDGGKPAVHLSARNSAKVTVLPFAEATAYEILHAESLVIESAALATKEGA